jgi:hypothetical protein
MNIDAELDTWREQWQSENTVPLDLRRRVERESRFMKLLLIADIMVTVLIGGGATAWAVRSPQPDVILLAVATWVFVAAAWTASLTINRGVWSPSALNTAAFLDLSIARCRGRLAAIRFGAGLFVCQLVFCLGWIYQHAPEQHTPVAAWLLFSSIPIDFVWVFTVAFFGFLFWYRRKKRVELTRLLDMARPTAR